MSLCTPKTRAPRREHEQDTFLKQIAGSLGTGLGIAKHEQAIFFLFGKEGLGFRGLR